MNSFCRILKIQVTLLIMACLFGCSGKAETEISQSIKPVVHSKAIKPGAPIKLISAHLIAISSNEQTHIDIVFETKVSSGELMLELSPSNGLDLLDTPIRHTISLTSSTAIKIPVNLVAVAEGRYYLNIQASLNDGDSVSARNLALIVQVGPVAGKALQLKKTSGDSIISLPAQETISNP